jgi:hypothetical protein
MRASGARPLHLHRKQCHRRNDRTCEVLDLDDLVPEEMMSASGLDVFDKTLQTTHIWLDEIQTRNRS